MNFHLLATASLMMMLLSASGVTAEEVSHSFFVCIYIVYLVDDVFSLGLSS